ncbi:hypothetical protein CPT_Suzuki_025 [Stenotrophomonas phage Suzuki]|nr:hypothetical protein CPT_Suzuki_025 [Stenotrophomonas phage Suzuki]
MAKYRIMKDGRHMGDITADDARQAGPKAVEQWGEGMYDISLVREIEDDEEAE